VSRRLELTQGATVGTAQEAVQRGFKVIVPVDCSAAYE
jgi:nicotinamidase-related amidase